MGLTGIEPVRIGLQPIALPFELQPLMFLEIGKGIEPSVSGFADHPHDHMSLPII